MKSSGKSDRYQEYQKQLRTAIRALLPARGLSLIDDDGRRRWTDRLLVMAAVLLAWSPANLLRDAFAQARDTLIAMYPTRRRPGGELSGFLRALQKRGDALLQRVTTALQTRTQTLAGAAFRWKGWVLLGADGSRINCPRTFANENGLGCAGKVRTAPQLLLVTLFHVATGLPWAWRRDRGDGSERGLLLEMLSTFAEKTLLLADAGFVGFALLKSLQDAGHAFVVRVGRNVTLLRKLGFEVREQDGTVYLWPQGKRKESPLVLRLVELQVGKRRIAVLTNLHDEAALRDADILSLYRKRWTIEVMYRSLKQTLGKRTLRADTPATARCELDWAMTGLWMLGLMAQQAGAPRAWSPAEALRVIHRVLRDPRRRAGSRGLSTLLRAARRDAYARTGSKTARNWPHKKTESPPGTPKVRMATKQEIAEFKALCKKKDAA
jgi:hypothetical protein